MYERFLLLGTATESKAQVLACCQQGVPHAFGGSSPDICELTPVWVKRLLSAFEGVVKAR